VRLIFTQNLRIN